MGKEIKTRIITDASTWDEFVQSAGGPVFSRYAWLDAVAPIQGGKAVRIGSWYEGRIAAGAAFIEISRGGLRKAVSPILTPYCGFLYGDERDDGSGDTSSVQQLCAEQLIRFLENRYHYTMLAHDPGFSDIRPFSWKGWTTGVRYTYLLDISNPDAVWEKCRPRARRQVARAEKLFSVGTGCDPKVIGDIHEQTFRAKGEHLPVTGAQVAAWVKALNGNGLMEVRTALDQNGIVAGVQVNVLGPDTVYTVVYGTGSAYRDLGVDALLLWDAVKHYSRTRRYLDLVGANMPSIAFFKRGFGGDLKPYYVTERYSSTLAQLALNAYSTAKKLLTR